MTLAPRTERHTLRDVRLQVGEVAGLGDGPAVIREEPAGRVHRHAAQSVGGVVLVDR